MDLSQVRKIDLKPKNQHASNLFKIPQLTGGRTGVPAQVALHSIPELYLSASAQTPQKMQEAGHQAVQRLMVLSVQMRDRVAKKGRGTKIKS